MAKSTAKSKQKKQTKTTAKAKAKKSTPKKRITTKKTSTVTATAKTNKPIEESSAKPAQQPAQAPTPPESEGTTQQRLTKTYLTPEELKHFEEILLQKRAEVLRDLEIMRASLQEENNNDHINSSYSIHMADHGTETLDREQRFMFIARDERYLSYIDKALERIKNGVYGICVKSGLPIPKERLEAVPHTAVRIEYKNR